MILIGLNGKIGSGKSTAADYLHDLYRQDERTNVYRLSFATALKNIAIDLLGLSYDDCYTQEGKARYNTFWGMTNREILQRIGTDAFRNGFHKDTWVKVLELQIIDFEKTNRIPTPNNEVIIIDDVRFVNEAEMIKRHDGKVFSIIRPNSNIENVGIQAHASEQDLPAEMVDTFIPNAGTIKDLQKSLLTAITTHGLLVTRQNNM